MQTFLNLLHTFGPGLLAAFVAYLPSLIVALTPYPVEQGVAKVILQILNVFSILTHKDSPGSLKPPVVQSKPPEVIGSSVVAVTAK